MAKLESDMDEEIDRSPTVLAQAFPSQLQTSALKACKSLFRSNLPSSEPWRRRFSVKVANEQVVVPTRVYLEIFPSMLDLMSEEEKLMQQCIWTRHHIGYKRQSALAEIIAANLTWTIPFVVFLVGEYVIEILDDIYANLNVIDDQQLAEFLANNPKFHLLTRQRVISYWNEYYRHQFKQSDYVGFKIMSHFDQVVIANNA